MAELISRNSIPVLGLDCTIPVIGFWHCLVSCLRQTKTAIDPLVYLVLYRGMVWRSADDYDRPGIGR